MAEERLTLYDFNRGSQEEQAAMVWQQGIFLAYWHWGVARVCLYHMEEFFAEVYYEVRDNHVDLVVGFRNRMMLVPYLDMVELSDISSG